MKRKEAYAQCKKDSIDRQRRTLRAALTTLSLDRDSEVVLPAGVELENFKRNPVLLWGHDPSKPPIGRWDDFKVDDVELTARANFLPPGKSQLADEVWAGFEHGALRAFSIGFRTIESTDEPVFEGQKGKTITRWELMEASAVPIPANTEAVVKAHLSPAKENEVLLVQLALLGLQLREIREELNI